MDMDPQACPEKLNFSKQNLKLGLDYNNAAQIRILIESEMWRTLEEIT